MSKWFDDTAYGFGENSGNREPVAWRIGFDGGAFIRVRKFPGRWVMDCNAPKMRRVDLGLAGDVPAETAQRVALTMAAKRAREIAAPISGLMEAKAAALADRLAELGR